MKNILNKIKKDTGNSPDIIYKTVPILEEEINIIYSEVLTDGDSINDFILKPINYLNNNNSNIKDIYKYIKNILPDNNVEDINNYKSLLEKLLVGYTIVILKDKTLAIETRKNLSRGVSTPSSEPSIKGPKDGFCEHYNTNLGLIRRRITSNNLFIKSFTIGKQTITKVGLIYMNNIVKKELVENISKKLDNINIDGIIDSGYIKRYLEEDRSFFPSIMSTERCDLVSQSLLEGKVCILVDNSCYVLILPTFFIDYFHTSDDYYQKSINISFIRIIRFLGFLISIFLPAYYIAATTINHNAIPISLLINFTAQRQLVPFPALIEAFLMSISFEILRESDVRSSNSSTAVSILGGLVLGEAAVSAGIVSPIMIIVIAISAISGLLFTSIEMISAIRWWRFILMFLGATLGMYGLFIGLILLIISLEKMNNYNISYLSPLSPIDLYELKDSLIKLHSKKKKRNKLLSNNIIRGRD
ncbi:MAG: spore germination protein [Bacilli bacterium]